ncbi:hypothetical protein L6164_028292 [Bauhinia variegata]|uniref:Uncharacterized protein n=1 Tax=Bauhinia variegata TaxID=167791 RepID=A0ACB9LW04_BAUVA|nr:hypothetical protein L6164_028292 [Bauhinia variegata]
MVKNTTCPSPMRATSNGVFQGDSPIDYAVPLVILQICLVVLVTRLLSFPLKLLRQPRVIAEILGGILLGPSVLGRNKSYLNAVFPSKSQTVLDTLANFGLLFFLFLVGLEFDTKSIGRTGKKALAIAFSGITVPFALGIGTSHVLRQTISKGVDGPPFLLFMGVAFSITAFGVLARILAELKLLSTDVGQIAMSAAAVNDVAAWILLALAISLSSTQHHPIVSLWVLLCGCGFLIACIYILPLIFNWMAQRCPHDEPVDELYICATLVIVLAVAFVTDAIGIHALFGAFVVGVFVPNKGPLAGALVEKVEDLVSGLFLPLYFVSSGLKTNVATIQGLQSWGLLVLVISTACFGKIIGTVVVSLFCKVPFREALALGFLMNTKGLVELIVLNIGKDRKVLNDQTFAIMVLMALFTTFITTPLVMAVYKPAKRSLKGDYKHNYIEKKDPNSQLRLLVCFHGERNIPSMVNLIEVSRGTEMKDGLRLIALHLRELTERPSAILISRKNGRQSDAIHRVVDFECFEQLSQVSIRPMTAMSRMEDIDEDICACAERQRATMIILPYHKHQKTDGTLENTRSEFRLVNRSVLHKAPCSVGILVDRGLGGTTHVSASNVSAEMTVLFFGGPDDHEALAYGLRMAEHPGVTLTILRFVASTENNNAEEIISSAIIDTNGTSDEKFMDEVKHKISNNRSIKFEEKGVESYEDIVGIVREYNKCHLFLIGRRAEGQVARLLFLDDYNVMWQCPELGPLCNLLTSPHLSPAASVLVVQQYYYGTKNQMV